MSDVECPYCGAEQEICHDDGYGHEEDGVYQQECTACDKLFVFTTSIRFSYQVKKADCLNGSPHTFKRTITAPIEYTRMCCTVCDEERPLTDEERKELMKNR